MIWCEKRGRKRGRWWRREGKKKVGFSAAPGRNSFHLRDSYAIHCGGASWLSGFHPCKAVGSGNSTVRSQQHSKVPWFSHVGILTSIFKYWGFPGDSAGKESACNASRRSSGEANGNPLQYSCLEHSMNRGIWWAIVHGVAKSRTRLSD